MKLGKHPPKYNEKTLLLRSYLKEEDFAPPPTKVYREYKLPTDWGTYMNDVLGICTCAAVAHLIMLTTAHTGTMVTPDPADILTAYSAITGYDASKTDASGNNPTDNGAAITDVLAYWQSTGIAGHKILGWCQTNHASRVRRQQGVFIFGANNVGVRLPAIAQQQFTDNATWDTVPDDGGIEGGHCIVEVGYGTEGSDFVTWGRGDQKATYRWSDFYLDESYVVVTQDWINEASGLAPSGFKIDQLIADLQTIKA